MREAMLGRRFGTLVVEGVIDTKVPPSGNRLYKFRTLCECGGTFDVWENTLRRQKAAMCPACRRTQTPINQHPLAATWYGMHDRCYRRESEGFKYYGKKGVGIHTRWRAVPGDTLATRKAFWAFVADMGDKPAGTTLDRVNTNGDYEPGNCRWAEDSMQQLNKRSTPRVDGVPVATVVAARGLSTARVTAAAKAYNRTVEEVVEALGSHTGGRIRWQQLLGVERKNAASYTRNTQNPHTIAHMKQTPTLQGKRRRNFYLPDTLMEEVEQVATQRATTATDIVRKALEAYVRAWKAKNDPR